MNFEKFESWFKRNKLLSVILIPLFLSGLVMQIDSAYQWITKNFFPPEYIVVDIHFDPAVVNANEISEGYGGGTSVFRVRLNEKGTSDLFKKIDETPNTIYLINLRGTTPINEQWMTGDRFALELVESICQSDDLSGFDCESVILHFPEQRQLIGWNSFTEGPASCCENFFRLRGFYRLSYFRDKMDRMNQYEAKYVEPDPEIAERSIKSLDEEKYFQIYADKWPENET